MARRSPPPPRPTRILLVRHGLTPTTGRLLPGRAPGLHLSDQGRAQADAVADRIAALDGKGSPVAVYASPLERTTETARPIARRLGLRVRSERGLIECDFGTWTGAALKDLSSRPEWREVQRTPSEFRFPGGESFLEMQTRIAGALARIVDRHRGETVVAVSHADPIKAALASAAGIHLDLFQRLVVSPCSVSALVTGDAGTYVLTVNSTTSLGELVPS